MQKLLSFLALPLLFLSCQAPSAQPQKQTISDADIARLHKDVLTLDTHIDFDTQDFTPQKNYSTDLPTQVNIPKMNQGGLDAGFFIVYTGQGKRNKVGYKKAHKQAMKKFKAVHQLTKQYAKDKISLATQSSQVKKIWMSGKKVAMIGVENAYPLGENLNELDNFYNLGARYISITHNGHSQFGDSNIPKFGEKQEIYGGLSPLGKKLIEKANQVGIMIDISHSSQKTSQDAMKLSKAPVIASHSGVMGVYNHPRNLSDKTLMALQKNGGVIQIIAFRNYVKGPSPDLLTKYNELAKKYNAPQLKEWKNAHKIWDALGKKESKIQKSYWTEFKKISKKNDTTSIKDFADHIDYAVKKIGIDHVGISSDFGGGGGVLGWDDASETMNVTKELVSRGYSVTDIKKIWGENLLRVWTQVEKVKTDLKKL